jgi:hypothetical protein
MGAVNFTVIRGLPGSSSMNHHLHVGPLIDFLQCHWPQGISTRAWVNGHELSVVNFDYVVKHNDDVVLAVETPQDPATVGAWIVSTAFAAAYPTATYLIGAASIAAFNVVVSMLLQALFPGPKTRRSPNKVYDVAGSQNGLALGSPIPEHFGRIWFSPTVASQPYAFYTNDNNQWLHQILLVGEGDYRIDETRVGTSKLQNIGAGLIEISYVTPAQHKQQLGYIRQTFGVHEDVVSVTDVQGIDLANDGSDTFFGRASASNNVYEGKELPDNFNVGDAVYVLGKDSATHKNHGVVSTVASTTNGANNLRLATKVLNDAGNPTYQIIKGTPENRWRGWYEVCPPHKTTSKIEVDISFPGGIYKTDDDGDYRKYDTEIVIEVQAIDVAGNPSGAVVQYKKFYQAKSPDPLRRTELIIVASGRYRVRVKREDADDSKSNNVSKVYWSGLKAYCDYVDGTPAYGNVTLMVVKYKAAAALSNDSASRITVEATRILNGVPTINPVDAFSYIAGNKADIANLTPIKTKWANTKGFNYRFDEETTVFNALEVIAASHRSFVQSTGKFVGLRLDRAKLADTALFTKQSMLEDSFSVVLSLGPEKSTDGIRGEIQASDGLYNLYFTYPPNAAKPTNAQLLGITDKETALRQVQYLWTKTDTTRRVANFTTEYDALVCRVGDRIAVLHEMTEWVVSARVMSVAGLVLTLDKEPSIQGAVKVRLRNQYGVPTVPVDALVAGDKLTLLAASTVNLFDPLSGQESTTVVIGSVSSLRKSYLVQEINPSDTSVGVSAISYTEAPYDDSFAIPGEAA